MTSSGAIVCTIAMEIEKHLAAHPDGADSAKGIRDWWLPLELHAVPLYQVVLALLRLEDDHLVQKMKLFEGGVEIYFGSARRNQYRVWNVPDPDKE